MVYNHSNIFTDDNECNQNNGGCSQNCINTIGSYKCACYEGYSLDLNGFSCSGKQANNYLCL